MELTHAIGMHQWRMLPRSIAAAGLFAAMASCGLPAKVLDRAPDTTGLVNNCAYELASDAYGEFARRVAAEMESEIPPPQLSVAVHGAGRLAQSRSPKDRLSFLRVFSEPEYEPRWRREPFLTQRAQELRRESIEMAYDRGGQILSDMVSDAIPLCEENMMELLRSRQNEVPV